MLGQQLNLPVELLRTTIVGPRWAPSCSSRDAGGIGSLAGHLRLPGGALRVAPSHRHPGVCAARRPGGAGAAGAVQHRVRPQRHRRSDGGDRLLPQRQHRHLRPLAGLAQLAHPDGDPRLLRRGHQGHFQPYHDHLGHHLVHGGALLLFGGDALYGFSFTLFAGILVGTISSITVASTVQELLGPRRRLTRKRRESWRRRHDPAIPCKTGLRACFMRSWDEAQKPEPGCCKKAASYRVLAAQDGVAVGKRPKRSTIT